MTEKLTDIPLLFTIPEKHCRGRFVRLDGVLNDILNVHDYPPVIRKLLAEAVTLAALLGSLLKEAGGQLTMQAQTQNGPVELLVVDYRGGEMRGYVRFDAERIAAAGPEPALYALFGQGYLAITFDQSGGRGRYQGIVPLDGESLAEACEYYFVQSEQIPSLFRIAVENSDSGCRSSGFVVQHLPEGEEGRERLHVRLMHPEWEHISILARTITRDEMLDRQLEPKALLWRLFHEEKEVRTETGTRLTRGCRCDPEHIRDVLSRFPAADQAEMVSENGMIRIDCEFCSRSFDLDPAELDKSANGS